MMPRKSCKIYNYLEAKQMEKADRLIEIRKKKRELARVVYRNPENTDAIAQLEKLEDEEFGIWNS